MWSCSSIAATSLSGVTWLFSFTFHVSCLSPQIAISLWTFGLSMRSGILRLEHSYILKNMDRYQGNGYPLQYSCLENSMNRRAWQAAVRGAAKELDTIELLSMHAHVDFIIRLSPPFWPCLFPPSSFFSFACSVCSLCFVVSPLPMCPDPWMSVCPAEWDGKSGPGILDEHGLQRGERLLRLVKSRSR